MEKHWWADLVTWALVLGGWFVVHIATLARERRKERREMANAAITALRQLANDSRSFHVAQRFDAHQADLLRYQTDQIIRSLQRAPLRKLELPLGKMVRLRKSITLQNADASGFSPQSADSPILRDIRSASDDLIEAIETAREDHWG